MPRLFDKLTSLFSVPSGSSTLLLWILRAAFVANRELIIALAEQHFNKRRSRALALHAGHAIAQLFDEVANANHAAINRLRRASDGGFARAPGR